MASGVAIRRARQYRCSGSGFCADRGGKPSRFGTGAIEIEIGGAVLRADAGVDLAFLGKIIRLLKAI